MPEPRRPLIVGAGFSGLAAALELANLGLRPIVIEAEAQVGGLASWFDVDGTRLERFYHHWFTSDREVMRVVEELGCQSDVLLRPTSTGSYVGNRFWKLSSPLDVLRFGALPLLDRVRLGLCVVRARRVRDWRSLEHLTSADWLREIGGQRVFDTIWGPLLHAKFGEYAAQIGAVWFWNKLVLRGGSRGRRGREELAYFRGGFAALADLMVKRIKDLGGEVRLSTPATALTSSAGRCDGVETPNGRIPAGQVLLTTPLPVAAKLLTPFVPAAWTEKCTRIDHLANLCLVLLLDRSLSGQYWTNVHDPSFPFVGVIEHTNFEPPETYHGAHVVYLSRYLPESDAWWGKPDEQVLAEALGHLRRLFPHFDRSWLRGHHVWRARWAQPVVTPGYGARIPDHRSPLPGAWLATMAQIYPEDRGTNYAIREGRKVAKLMTAEAP